MKITISTLILFVATSVLSAFTDNPTAPSDYFLRFDGNYTDTDGDGMTDVAERRYNYDPSDPNSRPIDIGYFIEQGTHVGISDTLPTGSRDDMMYFRFNNWPEQLENQYKDIIVHLMPIFFRKLGNPANTQILDIYNRGKGAVTSWTVSSQGRTMMASEMYDPRMFIHELTHAWKGKYTFTNKKGSSDTSWVHTKATAGFEEGSADGLTVDIILEFIESYPKHQMSEFCIKVKQRLRSGTTSTFDFLRNDKFMSCGNLWYDRRSIHLRYGTAGDTFRLFTTHDDEFMRKALDNYYAKVDADVTFRPTAENLINVFSEVLPEVNGVDTKTFLSKLPWLSGKFIPNRLHIACFENLQAVGGGAPWIYPAFADTRGKTFDYYITKESQLETRGLPSWIKYFVDSRGYWWPDHMNQPFEARVETIFGEHVDTIHDKTPSNYDSTGKPKDNGFTHCTKLTRSNFPLGLYKQTITFTEYAKHTDDAISEKYFFGYENFSQDQQNEFVIMLGVDCEVAEKVLFRLGDYTQTSEIVNGCAIFRTNKIPTNSKFIAEFDVFDVNGSKQTYKRAVIKTAFTRDNYLQHSYVVVDRNFNGIEDLYEEGEIVSLKNPNHLKYDDIRRNSHPMVQSFNDNLHNNVKVTLQSNGFLISSKGSKWMYVFDENDNKLGVSNKSSQDELRYLIEFSRYPKDSLKKLKVRTIKVVNGKNLNSPFRIFSVQDIVDGKLEEKNYEFVDENFVHNANDLNISSVLHGVQLTWKLFENEVPTIVIHNGSEKIADRATNGFIIDYEKFGLNGTEELSAHFEVLNKTEKQVLYRTKEFSIKLLDFKSLEQIEKDNLVKRYLNLVDSNNLPKFDVITHYNGIELDFNTSDNEFAVLNIIDVSHSSEFIDYKKLSLEGNETLRMFVEFFEGSMSNKKTMIVTDEFDLDLSVFHSEYLAKKNAMEAKFAVYADENGSTKCSITPQENGGILFEWDDADGLISYFVIFKNGELLTSRKGGSLLLDYEKFNLNGSETIEIRHAVRTLNDERVFYSSPTFIDLDDHKFIPESKWRDEFFSFVDENNNPKIVISKSKKYKSGIRFDWNDTAEFRGLLRVTRGGNLHGEFLIYGNHPKEFAEIDFFTVNTVGQKLEAEISLMVYDNLGLVEKNFHWESNIIEIDMSLYKTKAENDEVDSIIVVDDADTSEDESNSTNDRKDTQNNSDSNIVTEIPENPPVVVNAWDTCTSIGSNWFHSDWFGYFFKTEGNGWVFHETLGWFYTEFTTDFSSVWLFHETHGWVWTTNEYFPYLFNPKTANWLYVVEGGYFSFNHQKWFLTE